MLLNVSDFPTAPQRAVSSGPKVCVHVFNGFGAGSNMWLGVSALETRCSGVAFLPLTVIYLFPAPISSLPYLPCLSTSLPFSLFPLHPLPSPLASSSSANRNQPFIHTFVCSALNMGFHDVRRVSRDEGACAHVTRVSTCYTCAHMLHVHACYMSTCPACTHEVH